MRPPSHPRLIFPVACAALLSACTTAEASSAPRAETAVAASALPGEPDLSAPQTIATGVEVPWGLAFLPDGSALVAERNKADILQIPAGGGTPSPVYTVPGVVAAGEGGLLGLAVDPEYATNNYVYAYFTAAADNRIVRFTLDNAQPEVIFEGIDKNSIHNGGRIAFGPDGMLYVGTGDAGDGTDAQDPQDVNGKILRITRDGEAAPGNPTAGSPVWSMGHRNVQGLAWGGDGTMYGIEFGQNTWDEVNVIEPGKNYGWPTVEGKAGDSRFADPIVQWATSEASPSGAAVAGNTLYVAALRGERLWTVPLGGGSPAAEFTGTYGRLRTVALAPDGSLWLSTSNRDGRGTVRDGDDRILRFPVAG